MGSQLAGPPLDQPPYLAIALLSAAALSYEILLMRLFSIIQWHHFAYMMISVALLGYGAAGAFVTLTQRPLRARFTGAFAITAGLFGATAPLGFLAAQNVGFNALEILWDFRQLARLALIHALLIVPFGCAATAICLSFTTFPAHIPRLYAADIIGAAMGGLGSVGLLTIMRPETALRGIAVAGLAAGALAVWRGGQRRAVVGFALAALVILALPASWTELQSSPYKELAQTLQVAGTRVVAETSSPLGVVTVVESPTAPFRHAPGLSLLASAEPPPQLGLFTDGDGLTAINRFDGRWEPLAYLDFLTSALPYHLLQRPTVLILGAGGGTDILQALALGARTVDAVELNPRVVSLVQDRFGDFSGRPYSLPGVRAHVGEARGFVEASAARFDLIEVALLDAFSAAAAGLHGLAESYLYTVEALEVYLDHLRPGGLLAITRWVTLPPRDALKLFATAVAALEARGVADPGTRLAMIRGWKTATLLVKNGPFTPDEIAAIQAFCAARAFDPAWYPGMTPDVANRHNILDQPYFYEGATALLSARRADFVDRYKFVIEPATDDRPYFFRFFRWNALPEILALKHRGGLSLLEWGYPVVIATLAQAVVFGLVLTLLPLGLFLRREPGAGRGAGDVALYFTALGLAFMFVEIAFIQKFILFLNHPVYAVAVVLTAFLLFAGLGSRVAERFQAAGQSRRGVRLAAGMIAGLALGYALALPSAFQHLRDLADGVKMGLSVLLIAPLAFAMGMPFPLGLAGVAARAPALTPWAWALNGFASVVAAVLATVLAIHWGFTTVVIVAVALYLTAAVRFPGE
ncbi:MAG: SAM-dependent methyltransferase [Candidatus Contendobacter sp.]|nr:SAM-dependent methyltransferase [Candidatus Contendobacter sp.]MDG4556660.1 SAM-dependent methyltransferase [Candidatus Contendobacter sp.]